MRTRLTQPEPPARPNLNQQSRPEIETSRSVTRAQRISCRFCLPRSRFGIAFIMLGDDSMQDKTKPSSEGGPSVTSPPPASQPPMIDAPPPLAAGSPPSLSPQAARQSSVARQLLALLLSLCLGLFLIDAVVSLVDDSLILLFDLHLLAWIRGLLGVFTMFLARSEERRVGK